MKNPRRQVGNDSKGWSTGIRRTEFDLQYLRTTMCEPQNPNLATVFKSERFLFYAE